MLKKDDWKLTLNEAKNHRNGQLIALEISEAIIKLAEQKLKKFPKDEKQDKYKPNF